MILNEIQMKIASMECEKTFFISPEIDAQEELEKISDENLLPVTLNGSKFLINAPKPSVSFGEQDYTVFAQVNECLWIRATVYFYLWEVVYLVGGHKKVNELNFIMSDHLDGETKFFFRLTEFRNELAICDYKFSGENNAESFRQLYNKHAKRAIMHEDGSWQIIEGELNLSPQEPAALNKGINLLVREVGQSDFQLVTDEDFEVMTFNDESDAKEWASVHLAHLEYYLNYIK